VITIGNVVNIPLYIVHIMKKSAALEIRRAKKKGYVVFAEALAAGLGTDGRPCWDKDWDKAAAHIMSPALDDDPQTKELEMRLI
jgi:dihydropyrimidinase